MASNAPDSTQPLRKPTRIDGDRLFFLACLGLFFLSWALLYPGFLTHDAISQLEQARLGTYSDWNPPIMAWMWRWVDMVVPGKPGMLGIQLGIIWLGIYLVACALVRTPVQRLTLAVGIFLFPPVLGWAGAITKDTLMMGAALVGTGLVLRIGNPGRRSDIPALLAAAAAFTLVCALRHNGMFLVSGLAFLTGLRLYPVTGGPFAAVTGLILLLAPPALGQAANRTLTDVRSYPIGGLASFDIAGILLRRNPGDLTERQRSEVYAAFLKPSYRIEDLPRWHLPTDWLALTRGPLDGNWDFQRVERLKWLWKDLALSYPSDYLSHRADFGKSLLAVARRVTDPACFHDRGEITGVQLPERTKLQSILAWRLDWLVQGSGLFKPWPYYLVAWIVMVAAVWLRKPGWQIPFGLAVSGILHESALILLAPAAEYRYSAWMMVATALASIALLQGLRGALNPVGHPRRKLSMLIRCSNGSGQHHLGHRPQELSSATLRAGAIFRTAPNAMRVSH